jgi:hypothetical protein
MQTFVQALASQIGSAALQHGRGGSPPLVNDAMARTLPAIVLRETADDGSFS